MLKTANLTFLSPFVSSKTRSPQPKLPAAAWSGRGAVARPVRTTAAWVSKVSLVAVAGLGLMLALHLYWVNTYSAKGFALSEVQQSIEEQTDLQKKLLVQQSMLNSRAGLTDASSTGLVPVTEQEYLAPTNFAVAQ
jgi:hypothetical protein